MYNGTQKTWTEFKHYWASKPTGGWLYDDLSNNLDQSDKKRFKNAWRIAGPLFCRNKNIKYVDYNDAERQLKQTNGKTHFIFALDESGSMSGNRWKDLTKALA